jgi:hypothetical protein
MVKTIRLPILLAPVGRLRPAAFRSTAIEDKGGRSASTSPAYARAGYKLGRHIQLNLDVVNLFDEKTSDIGYDYQSRLNGEGPEGRNDIHFHRVEPRSFRLAHLLCRRTGASEKTCRASERAGEEVLRRNNGSELNAPLVTANAKELVDTCQVYFRGE